MRWARVVPLRSGCNRETRGSCVKSYEKLLSPIEIAPNFVLKNRMIKAPQSSWRWNEDCTADGSDAIAMYENMAEGGVAAINVAAILWEPAGGIYLGAYDDRFIPGMIELNEAVHKHGCLTIGQLHHIGRRRSPRRRFPKTRCRFPNHGAKHRAA